MERIRKHIVFYGMVQGVGFRYRAYYAARANGIGGWVKNLPDGSVEAEVEGREPDIDNMIMQLENGRFIQIDSMSVKSVPIRNESVFEVKY